MIVVTTEQIPGYRIEAVMGEVIGLAVRSANWGDNIGQPMRGLSLNELPLFTNARFQQRVEVLDRLRQEAARRGANAVLGIRFDGIVTEQGLSELSVIGTAVYVEPIPEGEPGATSQSAAAAAGTDEGAAAFSIIGAGVDAQPAAGVVPQPAFPQQPFPTEQFPQQPLPQAAPEQPAFAPPAPQAPAAQPFAPPQPFAPQPAQQPFPQQPAFAPQQQPYAPPQQPPYAPPQFPG